MHNFNFNLNSANNMPNGTQMYNKNVTEDNLTITQCSNLGHIKFLYYFVTKIKTPFINGAFIRHCT